MQNFSLEHYVDKLPDFTDYILDKLKDSGRVLGEANGDIGILVKLFAKPVMDIVGDINSSNRLENYGFNTYLKAGMKQAEKSIKYVDKIEGLKVCNGDILIELERNIKEFKRDFKNEFKVMRFEIEDNPVLKFAKNLYVAVMKALEINEDSIILFLENYNRNIEEEVKSQFGDDFEKHIGEIKKKSLRKSEFDLLEDTIKLARIGFDDDENFEYQKTYAKWEKIANFRNSSDEEKRIESNKLEEIEKEYGEIESYIEEYFSEDEEKFLGKILFIVSDFGKGKSVFMKNYASSLSKEYLKTFEGYFPVYFNLRDYKKYSGEDKLGIIKNYLLDKYAIDVSEEYFKKKKFIFLLDGLDECGELTKQNISSVINDVKKIQSLDKVKCRKNKIIITSRPINEGLKENMESFEPYTIKNDNNRDITHYLSIYGFKKYEFNKFINENILQFIDANKEYGGLAKEIIEHVAEKNEYDFHKLFLEKKLLSVSELKRPIFAYMVVQLIVANTDIEALGKIGIYLSFLNLLTKDAKHVEDNEYKINMQEEFRFRDTLHFISALWMKKRSEGKQTSLNKNDICRAIKGENLSAENASCHLKEISEFKFLSHSYFGEENNTLHFHHQSFAEILLAEYYLKLFIKHALDKNRDVNQIRYALSLGEPTEQTMEFFKELFTILKNCSSDESNGKIVSQRKMLFPIVASMAVSANKKIYSPYIDNRWYCDYNFEEEETEIPDELLENWIIGKKEIGKIVDLAEEILTSKDTILEIASSQESSLYSDELTVITVPLNSININTDKWIALVVGNLLGTDIKERLFFNSRVKNVNVFFDLIKERNFRFNESAPNWAKAYFNGIKNCSERVVLKYLSLRTLNFSFSQFKNISFERCSMFFAEFSNIIFENVEFKYCDLIRANFSSSQFNFSLFKSCDISYSIFDHIKINNENSWLESDEVFQYDEAFIQSCTIYSGIIIPNKIQMLINNHNEIGLINFNSNEYILAVRNYRDSEIALHILISLGGIIKTRNIFKNEVLKWFKIEINKEDERIKSNLKEFYKELDYIYSEKTQNEI